MCGILGSVNHPFTETHLDLLKHRGPDDSGFQSFQLGQHDVRLAQRRLSIIDLSAAGHQPMVSHCGTCAIIFNGEVYNHAGLRKKLHADIPWRGHCDTETILYYLRDHGISSLTDLNGIFALAFLDLRNQTLTLARDPFGVKPLYYHADHSSLVFASELRPVRSLLPSAQLDNQALATLLRLRFNPSPQTLYAEIRKVRPGHSHTFSLAGDQLTQKVESFISPYPEKRAVAFADAVTEYGSELENAVKRQLLSDVDIGILLSGGVDSAVVAALAAKHYHGKLKAFTVGFDGIHDEDEIDDAAETASVLGLDHYCKTIKFADFLSQLEHVTGIVEEPVATTSILPMYYLTELAAQHVKVVLTGQGADEPLGGYKKYRFELMRKTLANPIGTTIFSLARTLSIKSEDLLRAANSLSVEPNVTRFTKVAEVFGEQELLELTGIPDTCSTSLLSYTYDNLKMPEQLADAEKLMAIDARFNLADDLLNYTDKISMHHSIECRVPMLDLPLVRFIQSLPLKTRVNWRHQKRVHKAFAEKLLPSHIVHRRKKGFQSPTRLWFATESETIEEILLNSQSSFSKVFNQSAVRDVINQHKNGYNREKQIFLLLSIYYWMKRNT